MMYFMHNTVNKMHHKTLKYNFIVIYKQKPSFNIVATCFGHKQQWAHMVFKMG
jgi:hypothetical protein